MEKFTLALIVFMLPLSLEANKPKAKPAARTLKMSVVGYDPIYRSIKDYESVRLAQDAKRQAPLFTTKMVPINVNTRVSPEPSRVNDTNYTKNIWVK